MVRTTSTGREIATVPLQFGWRLTGGHGTRVEVRNPNTGEFRVVTVPMYAEIAIGTLRDIPDQCGAEDFRT